MSELVVFTDGASSGNPGPGFAMFVVTSYQLPVTKKRIALKHCTNNEAEYLAVVHALKYLIENPQIYKDCSSVLFRLDSKLVVEQLVGRWKIKDARMREFVRQVHELVHELNSQLPIPAHFTHIPREENVADALKYE